MRWKSVAIAGALLPLGAGCNIVHNTARNVVNEPHVSMTKHAITHDLRKSARAAFETARGGCPEHADSADFRDGFIDGYVDYLDKGGNASLPAVPPAKYTRHTKYFTENGQCLVKNYLLGFKYGQEVAIGTGRRQFLTVPVLLPQAPTGPAAFTIQPAANEVPRTMPPPMPPGPTGTLTSLEKRVGAVHVPPLPIAPAKPAALEIAKVPPSPDFDPAPKPVAEEPGKGPPPTEFGPAPMPEPERIAIPTPPLPISTAPGPSGPGAWGKLPAIPAMPTPALPLPVAEPAPRVLPPNHTVRPPLPPNHPQPRQ